MCCSINIQYPYGILLPRMFTLNPFETLGTASNLQVQRREEQLGQYQRNHLTNPKDRNYTGKPAKNKKVGAVPERKETCEGHSGHNQT